MTRLRPIQLAALVGATVALTACSGPLEPLNVQTQALPIGLVLGAHTAVVTAPVAPITLPPNPITQAVFQPTPNTLLTPQVRPAPRVPGSAPTKLGPCPNFNPLAPIGIVGTQVSKPPVPAKYSYRSTISSNTSGTKQNYTGPSQWTVSAASAPNSLGDYTYQVTTTVPVGSFSKTTTYQVVPSGVQAAGQQVPPGNVGGNPEGQLPTSAPAVASPEQPGIYLDGVTETSGSNSTSFVPANPVPLVQFPIQIGASFTTSGTDGSDSIAYTSTVTRQTKINACGRPVGVWEVALTQGTVTSSGSPDVSFTETLDFATSQGGLVVGDVYSSTGSQVPSGTVTLNESDTINEVPKATG